MGEIKKITDAAVKNATVLTPKQLRKYEPFKAEIANPIIRPKLVAKNLADESFNSGKEDDQQCRYLDLSKGWGSEEDELKGRKNELEEDYNFLRLANDLKKSRNKEKDLKKFESSNVSKSQKFYLTSKQEKNENKKSNESINGDYSDDINNLNSNKKKNTRFK